MGDNGASEVTEPPEYFADLHLDDIVTSVTARGDTRAVRPFFYAPLHDVGTITYRQEVFRDLEEETSRGIVRAFAAKMQVVRTRLDAAAKVPNRYERERWFLDAATSYCQAVQELSRELGAVRPHSRGLLAFADYLSAYSASEDFSRSPSFGLPAEPTFTNRTPSPALAGGAEWLPSWGRPAR